MLVKIDSGVVLTLGRVHSEDSVISWTSKEALMHISVDRDLFLAKKLSFECRARSTRRIFLSNKTNDRPGGWHCPSSWSEGTVFFVVDDGLIPNCVGRKNRVMSSDTGSSAAFC